jgi:hypothetical protein
MRTTDLQRILKTTAIEEIGQIEALGYTREEACCIVLGPRRGRALSRILGPPDPPPGLKTND